MLSPTVCLVGLAITIAGEFLGQQPVRAAGKVVASTAFLVYAWQAGLTDLGDPGRAVIAALVLSWVGDVLLLSSDKRVFLAGLVAFLLAHVGFAAASLLLGVAWPAVGVAAVPLALGAWAVLRWLGDKPGKLVVPVRAYIAVISGMVALSAGVAFGGAAPWRTAWLGAAVLFFVSDLFVARQRFVSASPWNRFFGLPPYYLAQLLFIATLASTAV